jgi:acetolactate decarboxylase
MTIPLRIPLPHVLRRTLLSLVIGFLLTASTAPGQTDVLYQVSTLDALVSGVFDGNTTLGSLLEHGDFGIGTFNGVDGEMILADGVFYRIDAKGAARRAGPDEKTPFAAVTFFEADQAVKSDSCLPAEDLFRILDARLPSGNLFYAIRIEGRFKSVDTRSVPRQQKPYPSLTDVVKTQPTFHFRGVEGMMAGFRCPEFVKGLNAAGYHLHFLNRDGTGGGHVLGFVTDGIVVEMDRTDGFRLQLPEDPDFLRADLSRDRSNDVKRVEK